jgi:hypothetical protein
MDRTMSAFASRLVRRLRDRSDAIDLTEPTFQGIVGYSDDARGWDPSRRSLTAPIDADTARARHYGRRSWSCVLRSSGRLVVVAQLTTGELRVMRFDGTDSYVEETREFHPVDDQLWLRSIKRVNGSEATAPAENIVTDWFTWVRPNTSATWTRFDATSPQGRQHELRLEWDPAGNWFAVPAWDDYDQLVEPSDLLARLWPESVGLPPAIAS